MNAQKSFQQKFLGSSILCNYHGCNVGSTLSSMVVSSVIIECCKLCPSYCRLPSADRIEYLFPSLPWYLDPGPALLSMTGLGCSKTDNYPVLRRVKLQPILMRNIRRKYEQNLIRVYFLHFIWYHQCKLEFNLLIYDLWSRTELEILPQFQAGPKDILAQKLHSFQLMLNENKQKVSSKQYHYSAEGVFLPALKQHWCKTKCLLLSIVRHVLGVGEGQPANL